MFRKSIGLLLATILCTSTLQAKDLIPGGESVGIQVGYDGILVSGTYVFTVDGKQYDPSLTIQPNDIIVEINGVKVTSLEDMSNELNNYRNAVNSIPITILRDHNTQTVNLTTVYNASQNAFRSGLYVKDKLTGVGTISFYDPQTGRYGALGHEIMDVDTNQQATIRSGSIYPANVDTIQKAKVNVPGEKQATIDFSTVLGSVDKNSFIGIYGAYQQVPEQKPAMPMATHNEVHTGNAMIYTVLHGNKIQAYSITITKVHKQKEKDMKGIELSITDDGLKQETNGIIQGMSGSPIIQDGKIVGALTHVITSDPMKGYGVFIDWMIEESTN